MDSPAIEKGKQIEFLKMVLKRRTIMLIEMMDFQKHAEANGGSVGEMAINDQWYHDTDDMDVDHSGGEMAEKKDKDKKKMAKKKFEDDDTDKPYFYEDLDYTVLSDLTDFEKIEDIFKKLMLTRRPHQNLDSAYFWKKKQEKMQGNNSKYLLEIYGTKNKK